MKEKIHCLQILTFIIIFRANWRIQCEPSEQCPLMSGRLWMCTLSLLLRSFSEHISVNRVHVFLFYVSYIQKHNVWNYDLKTVTNSFSENRVECLCFSLCLYVFFLFVKNISVLVCFSIIHAIYIHLWTSR